MLARQAGPAPDFPVRRRLAAAAALGFLASSVLALVLIGPLPAAAFYTAAPWIKFVYAVLLLAGASALAAISAGTSAAAARACTQSRNSALCGISGAPTSGRVPPPKTMRRLCVRLPEATMSTPCSRKGANAWPSRTAPWRRTTTPCRRRSATCAAPAPPPRRARGRPRSCARLPPLLPTSLSPLLPGPKPGDAG